MPGSVEEPVTMSAPIMEYILQLQHLRKQLEAQRLLRRSNLNVKRPDEEELKQLDSSVKRNTALSKKLRALSEETRTSILDDISKLNQSKYVSEAVTAVAEAPLRTADVPAAVTVCCALHQRYSDFGPQMATALAKSFTTAVAGEDERSLLRRRRSLLRLMMELQLAGMCNLVAPLLSIVRDLSTPDYRRDRDAAQAALSLLALLAKTGRDTFLGMPITLPTSPLPTASEQAVEQPSAEEAAAAAAIQEERALLQSELDARYTLPEVERSAFASALDRALQSASTALLQDHASLVALDRENTVVVNTRGDLPADAAAERERRLKNYEALHRGVCALAEALGKPPPALDEDAFTQMGAAGLSGGACEPPAALSAEPPPLFDDPETRAFYTSLPDLNALVPAILLADSKEEVKADAAAAADSAAAAASASVDASAESTSPDPLTEAAESTSTATPITADTSTAAGPDTLVSAALTPTTSTAVATAAASSSAAATMKGTAAPSQPDTKASQEVQLILRRLPTCVSRDLCDELTVNFCYVNSKAARRRLCKALIDVPRASLQLLPFYARIVASLAQVFPDVPTAILTNLTHEFNALVARKDMTGMTLESRLRNSRYLAELAKFKLLPHGTYFTQLKTLLDDFQGHNVDAAVALVETAGLMMYRQPETCVRMENMLEVMMRLKNVRNLGPRQSAEVENAYYQVKRPEKAGIRRKKRPPMQEYIRHLIFHVLDDNTISDVAKKLLKLPWASHEQYVLKCMMKVVRGRFTNIPLVTCLAGGLAQCHDSLGIAFVDGVLEDIRWGLENPTSGTYQKRMADVRLLGELYNYMLCNSTPIFETLYLFITFGHESPELAAKLDPPSDFFRVRLVCALLDACGCYFTEGAASTRLDRFLTFLQSYLLSKPPMPLDVDFDLQDIIHSLRPTLHRYSSYQEAAAAVQELLREEAEVGGQLGSIAEDADSEEEEDRRALGARAVTGGRTEDQKARDADACSLSDVSGRSSGDERDEVDEEFERELQGLLGPSGLNSSSVGSGAAIGSSKSSRQQRERQGGGRAAGTDGEDGEEEDEARVTFRMLMKRGGRDDRSKELKVPLSASMAVSLQRQAAEEARERQELKRLTLQANRVQQAEDAAAGLLVSQAKVLRDRDAHLFFASPTTEFAGNVSSQTDAHVGAAAGYDRKSAQSRKGRGVGGGSRGRSDKSAGTGGTITARTYGLG